MMRSLLDFNHVEIAMAVRSISDGQVLMDVIDHVGNVKTGIQHVTDSWVC
jgi:hypothetical protein